MTANQIAYWKQQEEARHNAESEYEARRSNKAKEAENYRSNYAKEQETNRHNLATEGHELFQLQTQASHYLASDEAYMEQARAALAQAGAAGLNAQTNASNLDYMYWKTEQEMEQFYANLRYLYAALDQNETLAGKDRTKDYITAGMRGASELLRSVMPYLMGGSNNNKNDKGSSNNGGGTFQSSTTPQIGANLEKIFGKGMSTIMPMVGGSSAVLPLIG